MAHIPTSNPIAEQLSQKTARALKLQSSNLRGCPAFASTKPESKPIMFVTVTIPNTMVWFCIGIFVHWPAFTHTDSSVCPLMKLQYRCIHFELLLEASHPSLVDIPSHSHHVAQPGSTRRTSSSPRHQTLLSSQGHESPPHFIDVVFGFIVNLDERECLRLDRPCCCPLRVALPCLLPIMVTRSPLLFDHKSENWQ